ncbi:MAG TPA: hypothetical protein VGV88_11815 [Candidatus Dormibacteraeota bacterium]|nr:hypothetical protein [Candidatus Dormibacteraeota bacterium]
MSADPNQYDGVITLEPRVVTPELVPPEAPAAVELPPPPAAAPAAPAAKRRRPGWIVPTAIAVVGLLASGTLGYLFYSTNTKLDMTKQSLAATKDQLTALQADAAQKKQVADYMTMYTVDSGAVRTDYSQVVLCSTFGTCLIAAQDTLNDLQKFQTDRKAARVPSGLSSADSQLGDSLSAAIAAVQELISGMTSNDHTKADAGFNDLDSAMLGVAKAESALGAELR